MRTKDPDTAAIDALPPLREIIAAHGLSAKKALGQNFLCDLNITDKIARAAGDLSSGTTFEIGPGPGGLTRSLLRSGAERVIAVEFDPRAIAALDSLKNAAQNRLDIVNADALTLDLVPLAAQTPRRIVANLPYNIATPLLIGWLRQMRTDPNAFESLTLMFQREVADRLVAQPKTKAYGRLSILAQWLCRIERKFDIPPSLFVPPPKVTSSVVHFLPRPLPPDAPVFATVEKITAAAFGQRRKMLRSSLKGFEQVMQQSGITPSARAEDLAIEDFIRMAQNADRKFPERHPQ